MKTGRTGSLAAAGLLLMAVVGCDEKEQAEPTPSAKESCGEVVQTPLERIKIELADIAATVPTAYPPQYDYVSTVRDRLAALPDADCEAAFRFMAEIFARPRLKEFPLSQRESSLDAYMSIVRQIAPLFAEKMETPSKAWEFLLGTLSVLDQEYKTVSAPGFDPRNPPMGIVQMVDDYLVRLDNKRFRAVREWFEISTAFSSFYRSLPEASRLEWQNRLEKSARRKVVIYDPADPRQELPRRRFTVSPYLPEDMKEKKRAERRRMLIEAGIDPAKEGL